MAECMDFPNTFKEFIDEYSFKDREEIYTNGSELIQTFRVMQGYEHFIADHDQQIRNETIDEFALLMKEALNHDWATTKISDMMIYNRLFDKCNEIAEKIKERD